MKSGSCVMYPVSYGPVDQGTARAAQILQIPADAYYWVTTRSGYPRMADNVESLVIEHSRHIRGRVDQIADGMSELKQRMSSLETAMVLVKREVAASDETDVRFQTSLDKIVERIQRIEKRLELS